MQPNEKKDLDSFLEDLTPEEKRDIFYHGGLRAKVELAGETIILGEVALKDKNKIFMCFESDIRDLQRTYKEYVRGNHSGILGVIASFFRTIFGMREKVAPAISIMKEFVSGMTANDVKLIQICAEGHNERTTEEIGELVMNAPGSQVQVAIRHALRINGIDTKKFMAARKSLIPTDAARTKTSTAGSQG
jgi:hypothetical protein